jgi:hypothetical protein
MVSSPDWVVKAIRISGVDVTDTGIDLSAGRDANGFEVELTNRPPEVSGAAVNARGEPQKDYMVLFFTQERERWIPGSRLITTARHDRVDGRYKVRSLPPGRYLAVALEQTQGANTQDPDFLESLRPRATSFTLADGETKLLDLRISAGR